MVHDKEKELLSLTATEMGKDKKGAIKVKNRPMELTKQLSVPINLGESRGTDTFTESLKASKRENNSKNDLVLGSESKQICLNTGCNPHEDNKKNRLKLSYSVKSSIATASIKGSVMDKEIIEMAKKSEINNIKKEEEKYITLLPSVQEAPVLN